MHGTLLDQRVFESLVHKCLPIIYDHFTAVDVQLSVASLPWFLSLYVIFETDSVGHLRHSDAMFSSNRFINSMPMVFAFRIIDCFFCMGPKVLFQVGCVERFSRICANAQLISRVNSLGKYFSPL